MAAFTVLWIRLLSGCGTPLGAVWHGGMQTCPRKWWYFLVFCAACFLSFQAALSDDRREEFAAVDKKSGNGYHLETAHFCRQVSVYGQEIPRQATQGVSQNTMQN